MKLSTILVGALWTVPLQAAPFPLSVQVESARFTPGQGAVEFHLSQALGAEIQAVIYDQNDRRVAVPQIVEPQTLRWDGRDGSGRYVHPGTYFIEITEEPYLWNSAVQVLPDSAHSAGAVNFSSK